MAAHGRRQRVFARVLAKELAGRLLYCVQHDRCRVSAELVKETAAGLVERHAARLGMDSFTASSLVEAIRSIEVPAPAAAASKVPGIEIPRDELALRISLHAPECGRLPR